MKKLIIILLTITLLSSCNNRIGDTPLIINITEFYNDKICKYYVNSTFDSDLNTFNHEEASFLDSCSKFNVGDTIKLTK